MTTLERTADYFVGHFEAMASNCEVLIDTIDKDMALKVTNIVSTEVIRIEQKYSRYSDDNLLCRINHGEAINVDDETARLLDYAQKLYQLSDGLFDITSGVLRRAWHFDGSDNIPTSAQIDDLLPLVNWQKVNWQNPHIQLADNMEIDFGGIGKEYAADRAAMAVSAFLAKQSGNKEQNISALINLGGDLAVTGPRKNGDGWQVGINTDSSHASTPSANFSLKHGGVATSGDANRYLQKNGVRYGHVLDPHTGWPIKHAPAAVTVVAASCTDAGMLSTMALLQGATAEEFLREQDVFHWCQW